MSMVRPTSCEAATDVCMRTGNIFVNKHLHVKGHMHIDKIITPKVFIHSRTETPQYGRGIMIGNDLPNKFGTKSNMRIGYNEQNAWIQSHKDVPLTMNPLGGGTCVACKQPKKGIELHVGGDALVDGEVYVATLQKQVLFVPMLWELHILTLGVAQKAQKPADDTFSLTEAKSMLEQELGAVELNVVSAWSSATKIIQDNHKKILLRQLKIQENEDAIKALERQFAS